MTDRIGQIFTLPSTCIVLEKLGLDSRGNQMWRILFLETGRTMRIDDEYLATNEYYKHRIT